MSVDKSASRIRQMFGEIAGRYDLLNHVLSLGADRWWRRQTARLVRPAAGGRVLDVCTGTADLALAYWRAGGGHVHVVGADFCRPMLEIGKEKLRRAGAASQVTLIEADALALPFPDDCFHVVVVAFGLRNLSDTDRGLREMARVCRSGGRVAVLEFSIPRTRLLSAVYGWYFRYVLPRVGEVLASNRQKAYNYLPASVEEFPEQEALVERLRAAGLGRVWRRRLCFGVVTLYVGEK